MTTNDNTRLNEKILKSQAGQNVNEQEKASLDKN